MTCGLSYQDGYLQGIFNACRGYQTYNSHYLGGGAPGYKPVMDRDNGLPTNNYPAPYGFAHQEVCLPGAVDCLAGGCIEGSANCPGGSFEVAQGLALLNLFAVLLAGMGSFGALFCLSW